MEKHKTICRTCHNYCAVVAEVENGKVLKIAGDHEDPVYHGYSCNKGRAHPALYDHPDRIRQSLKKLPDGGRKPIGVQQAIEEIAGRLRRILDEHGPRAIAIYQGTYGYVDNPASFTMLDAFTRALGTPMVYTTLTIDQSGKLVAEAMHGKWMGGDVSGTADTVLAIGKNPLISHLSWAANPGDAFKELQSRNGTLIVIDPRRTETARRATLHLQPRPGTDAAILAGMLNVILVNGWEDRDFIADNVTGVEDLRTAIKAFPPAVVAHIADISEQDLVEAARLFAAARPGFAGAGTGPNMSGDSTLIEYLILCLLTVCGHWRRAGETVRNAMSLTPTVAQLAKAQAIPPTPAYGFGEPARVRGLGLVPGGMPTATAAEEILLDGPGQVRALLSLGGNPVSAWPDQSKTVQAMAELELLVSTDVVLATTSKMADYVIAMKLPYEQQGSTFLIDFTPSLVAGMGARDSYANYTPALVEPPSEVLDNPTFLFKLAQAMGLQLDVYPGLGSAIPGTSPVALDMNADLDMDRLFDIVHSGSRIPFEQVRSQEGGRLYPDPAVIVEPKDPGWTGCLDVANPDIIADLAALATREADHPEYPFRLISRRMPHVYNSPIPAVVPRGRPHYNPAFVHPADLERLGLTAREVVEIRSPHDAVTAVVEPDDTMRQGTISMSHSWGDLPDSDDKAGAVPGSCTARLVDNTAFYDRYTGQPQMSNIPVAISTLPE